MVVSSCTESRSRARPEPNFLGWPATQCSQPPRLASHLQGDQNGNVPVQPTISNGLALPQLGSRVSHKAEEATENWRGTLTGKITTCHGQGQTASRIHVGTSIPISNACRRRGANTKTQADQDRTQLWAEEDRLPRIQARPKAEEPKRRDSAGPKPRHNSQLCGCTYTTIQDDMISVRRTWPGVMLAGSKKQPPPMCLHR